MQLRSAIVAGRSRAARFPVVTDPSPSRRTKSAQLWFVVIPVCVMPVHGQARGSMARPARDRLRPQPRFPEGPPRVHPRYICALTSQDPACEKGRPGECDVIVGRTMLHHIPMVEFVLGRLLARLKPGTRIGFLEPDFR